MKQQIKDVLMDDFWIMPATPEYAEEGIPYITSKNIKNGMIDFSKVNYISQEAYEGISKNRPILVGDILISMIGTLGEAAEIAESDGLFYGQNMFLVRLDESKINKRYFLNFLKSNYVKRELDRKQNQSTQKYLKANHIEDLTIPVPTLEEQYVIAWQLDKLAAIIALRKTEDRLLDEIIKARFVEMFTSIKKERLLGDISEFVTVGIANSATHAYTDSGIPMLRNQNIKENHLDDSDLIYINPEFAAKYESKKLKENDIIVMRTGYPGVACLVPSEYEGCQTFTTLIVRLKEDNNPRYVCSYINSDLGKSFIESEKVGVAQQNVGAKSLAKMPIRIAPKDLQDEYVAFVAQVDKSKAAVQKALDETQLLFDSLMQEYFG